MLKDKSGQLMLISAFMLAMTVVTITLMLNNVIFASNLAYVGFMDQTRYDDISLKQATAREMNYADNVYKTSPTDYSTYMTDYTDAINRIASIKGKYVELTSATNPNPLPFTNTKNTLLLSLYSKDTKVSYAITTGDNTPVTPVYDIHLDIDRASILCGGAERATLTAKVTRISDGSAVTDQCVKFAFTRNTGKIVDADGNTEPMMGWLPDASGNVIVYYSDFGVNEGIETIYAYIGGTKSNEESLFCDSNSPPTFTIDLSPHTPPNLAIVSDNVDKVMLTVSVKDGVPVSGVLVKFDCDRGTVRIDDIANSGSSGWYTGPDGTVVVYVYDTDKDHPGDAHITAYVASTSGTVTSLPVTVTCQAPAVCTHIPDISGVTTVTHGNGNTYFINIPITSSEITINDILLISSTVTSIPVNDVSIDTSQPIYSTVTKIYKIPVQISGNPTYTITLKVTFKGVCIDNPDYSRDGTIIITGNKNSATATLTFP